MKPHREPGTMTGTTGAGILQQSFDETRGKVGRGREHRRRLINISISSHYEEYHYYEYYEYIFQNFKWEEADLNWSGKRSG